MEKIINEFADEAGFLIEGDKIYADSFNSINDILEEFAKLIIEKCGDIADNSVDHGIPSAYIDEYFGV
ncbi:hypothetical protein UFOVP132_223 [uncultured Caudovirales phage]|uniref:Uncharacterized protein n=1 Tax=uncultured Caudovirales phage TaxID=2100421 RepID=A0A6J5LDT3_9CAUD|nr:hypothetical protein UFOVP132_223 [uncultured Caudovirales phage]